jgi:hypothetical protein
MTALGEKIKFFSATAHCLSDQLFAVVVTFRGVDHIQTGIERAIQQFSDNFRRRVFVADLGSSNPRTETSMSVFPRRRFSIVSQMSRGLRGCRRINAKANCAIRD